MCVRRASEVIGLQGSGEVGFLTFASGGQRQSEEFLLFSDRLCAK